MDATSLMPTLVYLTALLCSTWAQTLRCAFQDSTGYSLSWSVSEGNIYFNLSFLNFPTNAFTGVGFGDNMESGIDAILVQLSGNQVQVVDASIQGYRPPIVDTNTSVTVKSASYRDQTLRAEFFRRIITDSPVDRNLDGCNTWNFISTPGTINNGQYEKHMNTPKQAQVCDVTNKCQSEDSDFLGLGILKVNQRNNYDGSGIKNYNNNKKSGMDFNSPLKIGEDVKRDQIGNTYGYIPNSATPPTLQPYTGIPFLYSTSTNPTYGEDQEFLKNSNATFYDVGMDTRWRGNTYGYSPNTATSPRLQPYTGTRYPYHSSTPATTNYNGNTEPIFFNPAPQNVISQNANYRGFGNNYIPSNKQTHRDQQIYGKQFGQDFGQGNSVNGNSYQTPSSAQVYYNSRIAPQNYILPFENIQQVYGGNGQGLQNHYFEAQQSPQQYYSNQIPTMRYRSYPQFQNNNYYSQQEWRKKRDLNSRIKRQNSYQPTDNIYGYNYNSDAPSDGLSLVRNPNYQFLNDQLAAEYERTYYDATRQFDQNSKGQNGGTQAPIFTNEQQNKINYQQIQRDYQNNPNPTAGNIYTNNIYGYNYLSSGSVMSSNNVNRLFDPPTQHFLSNLYTTSNYNQNNLERQQGMSSTPAYQSIPDLKQTRLRNPSNQSTSKNRQLDYSGIYSSQNDVVSNFFDPVNNQSAMYYPYRTLITNHLDTNSHRLQSDYSNLQNNDIKETFQGLDYGPCSLPDPYWCSDYVNVYFNSLVEYSQMSRQTACQLLVRSLQDSYNECCHIVQTIGCHNML